MLDNLTVSHFEPHICGQFRVDVAGIESIVFTLNEVWKGSAVSPVSGRTTFSLLFYGPTEPLLPQGTYRIEHPDLGNLDLFIVPLGPDNNGVRYEAVFN